MELSAHVWQRVPSEEPRVQCAVEHVLLLARDFGPVNSTTPETHFSYQTIVSELVIYHSSNGQGEIVYANASNPYSVVVVERGYFAETGYRYGTDYEQLCRQGDVVVFGFAERFVFDIYLIPTQGLSICQL